MRRVDGGTYKTDEKQREREGEEEAREDAEEDRPRDRERLQAARIKGQTSTPGVGQLLKTYSRPATL